jgi:tetratricopeptide (TPR) repeat protein
MTDLRNAVSHAGKKPSATECLSGVLAIYDILVAQKLAATDVLSCIESIKSLLGQRPDEISEKQLDKDSFAMFILEVSLDEFMQSVGDAILHFWDKKNFKKCPKIPMELPEIKKELRKEGKNGGNSALRQGWQAYMKLSSNPDNFADFLSDLERVHDARKELCHNPRHLDTIQAMLAIIRILQSLRLDHSMHSERLSALSFFQGSVAVCGGQDVHQVRISDCVDLIGREILTDQLVGRISSKPWSREVLFGLSGVGKTSLARGICEKLQNFLPVQVLMQGSSESILRMDLARFARLVREDVTYETDEDYAVKVALNYLERHSGWLLLIDDVKSMDAIAHLFPTYNGEGFSPAGHILFTTTEHVEFSTRLFISGKHHVDCFSPQDSMQLLRTRGCRGLQVKKEILEDPVADVRGFVERDLGNLPLGVAMLKSALSGQLSILEARECMQRCRSAFVAELGGKRADRYVKTLQTMLEEMLKRVELRCNTEAEFLNSQLMLDVLAVLDPQETPNILFSFFPDSFCHDLSRIRRVLSEVGLISFDSLKNTFTIHSLIQRCLKTVRTGGRDEVLLAWGKLRKVIQEQFIRKDLSTTGDWGLFRTLFVSVKHFVNQGFENGMFLLADHERAEMLDSLADAARQIFSNYKEALGFCEDSIKLRNLSTVSCFQSANTKDMMGIIHRELGQFPEALQFHEEALSLRNKVYLVHSTSDEVAGLARTYNNIANVLQLLNKSVEALEMYKLSLDLMRSEFGNHHVSIAASLKNVGVLHQNQGSYSKALENYIMALEIEKECLGDNHVCVAVTLNNMGPVLVALGCGDVAQTYYEKSLDILRGLLDERNVKIANTRYNMATLLLRQGKGQEAEVHFDHCAQIYEESFGAHHSETLDAKEKARHAKKLHRRMNKMSRKDAIKKEKETQFVHAQVEKTGCTVVRRLLGAHGSVLIDSDKCTACFFEFSTAGVPDCQIFKGHAYYEIEVLEFLSCSETMFHFNPGEGQILQLITAQIGWATVDMQCSDDYCADGVGDNQYSWAVDGIRCLKWGTDNSDGLAQSCPFGTQWKVGDIVGLCCDVCDDSMTLSVSVNGSFQPPNGEMFRFQNSSPGAFSKGIFPAISGGQIRIRYNFGNSPFKFGPPDLNYQGAAWFSLKNKELRDIWEQKTQGAKAILTRIQGVPLAVKVNPLTCEAVFNNFSTVGTPDCQIVFGKGYYEIELLDIDDNHSQSRVETNIWGSLESIVATAQIGWATVDMQCSDNYCADGVGYNQYSWAVDGIRCLKWGADNSDGLAQSCPFGTQWKVGDIVGLCCDVCDDSMTLSVSVNGSFQPPNGEMFRFQNSSPGAFSKGIFPAISGGQIRIRYNFGNSPFKFGPPNSSYKCMAHYSVQSTELDCLYFKLPGLCKPLGDAKAISDDDVEDELVKCAVDPISFLPAVFFDED